MQRPPTKMVASRGQSPLTGFMCELVREAGVDEQVTALAGRAVAHAVLDDPAAVAYLLQVLREAGAEEQVTALLARDPAAHAVLDDSALVAWLLEELLRIEAAEQVNIWPSGFLPEATSACSSSSEEAVSSSHLAVNLMGVPPLRGRGATWTDIGWSAWRGVT